MCVVSVCMCVSVSACVLLGQRHLPLRPLRPRAHDCARWCYWSHWLRLFRPHFRACHQHRPWLNSDQQPLLRRWFSIKFRAAKKKHFRVLRRPSSAQLVSLPRRCLKVNVCAAVVVAVSLGVPCGLWHLRCNSISCCCLVLCTIIVYHKIIKNCNKKRQAVLTIIVNYVVVRAELPTRCECSTSNRF